MERSPFVPARFRVSAAGVVKRASPSQSPSQRMRDRDGRKFRFLPRSATRATGVVASSVYSSTPVIAVPEENGTVKCQFGEDPQK